MKIRLASSVPPTAWPAATTCCPAASALAPTCLPALVTIVELVSVQVQVAPSGVLTTTESLPADWIAPRENASVLAPCGVEKVICPCSACVTRAHSAPRNGANRRRHARSLARAANTCPVARRRRAGARQRCRLAAAPSRLHGPALTLAGFVSAGNPAAAAAAAPADGA